jgi:hypothetical protein
MKLVLKIVLAVIVVLAATALVFLFTDWEAPVLGQKLIAIAGEAAGIELEAERVVLNLRKGLLLEGIVASSEADGESMTAVADLLQVDCALIPLIRGDIVVRRIVLQSPRVEVVSRDTNGAAGGADEGPSSRAQEPMEVDSASQASVDRQDRPKPVSIDELAILDARFVSRVEGVGTVETVIEELDFELFDFKIDESAASAVLGTTGHGRLTASGVRLDDRALSDLVADLEADRGRYLMTNVEAVTARSGRIEIERVELDMGQDPYRYRIEASVPELDLDAVLTDIDAPGLGRATLTLDATGEGPGLSGAVAEMVIELGDGTLPSVEMLAALDRFLGTTLDSAPYEGTEIRLSLVDGLLEVEPFEIVSGIAKLGIGGTVELDGDIDLKVPVGLPRDAFQRDDVPADVLDSLTLHDWLTIPLAVTGTVGDPVFGPDMDVVRELTRRMAESARAAAESRIRSELEGVVSGLVSRSDRPQAE